MHNAPRPSVAANAPIWWILATALVVATLSGPAQLRAQAHDHAGHAAPPRDARLELVLGGPHLLLYHRGYLSLGETQIAGLQRLRRTVCDAEQAYVEQAEQYRARFTDLLGDSVALSPQPAAESAPPSPLQDAMIGLARVESQWLTTLMHARRDGLALLTPLQRENASALRTHWARESLAMIQEATRPGQRGHPGTQIPIRVPGLVVGETTLMPYCEVLHGPASHIVIPPPR